jgi:hypothetical protein
LEIERFIKGFNKQIGNNGFKYSDFSGGCCFHFASMLKGSFPSGAIVYDAVRGHFMLYYNDKYYDMNGTVEVNNNHIHSLEEIKVKDKTWYKRVDYLSRLSHIRFYIYNIHNKRRS